MGKTVKRDENIRRSFSREINLKTRVKEDKKKKPKEHFHEDENEYDEEISYFWEEGE